MDRRHRLHSVFSLCGSRPCTSASSSCPDSDSSSGTGSALSINTGRSIRPNWTRSRRACSLYRSASISPISVLLIVVIRAVSYRMTVGVPSCGPQSAHPVRQVPSRPGKECSGIRDSPASSGATSTTGHPPRVRFVSPLACHVSGWGSALPSLRSATPVTHRLITNRHRAAVLRRGTS